MISANVTASLYLVSGIFFILALRGLSSPETSRKGNFFGIAGMAIAVVVTLLSLQDTNILIKNYIYRNVCIYLDAHLCQDHLINKKTFGNEETGTPIKIELNVIESEKNNFDNINLLIDDIRLFDINFQNYPSKNYLVDWCKKNNFKWEISHDIFVAKYTG